MSKKKYQIKITLQYSNPEIWRRIIIPSDLPLRELHQIIQTVMGWTNSHLHQFIKDGQYFLPKYPDDEFWDDTIQHNYIWTKVHDLLKEEKDTIIYNYDFGDSWDHIVLLEKIEDVQGGTPDSVCIGGERNCPPEDCGGIPGYEHLLDILDNSDDEEYEFYSEWVGEDFDPEYFDPDEVNDLLQEENYGCITFLDD